MKKKQNNTLNEETKEIKTLIIITVIIIVISVGLYFLTEKSLNKQNNSGELPEGVISYSEIMVGTMFDRPYKEYYVFLYSNEDEEVYKLDSLYTNYEEKENSKKIYFIDIDNGFNEFIKSDKANKKPTNASEVKINNRALILIKDGKVSKYYETLEEIEKVLN